MEATMTETTYPRERTALLFVDPYEAGGHFAAWEQPAIFSREVRDAFRPLRKTT